MATKTVTRGTNRPAAEARKAKAAQRDVKESDVKVYDNHNPNIPATKTDDGLDKLKVGELRKLMVDKGWSTGTKGTKREMIELLRKHPDGPQSGGKDEATEVKTSRAVKPAKKAAPVRHEHKQAKPAGKAAQSSQDDDAKPAKVGRGGSNHDRAAAAEARMRGVGGWQVKRDRLTIVATKGSETITVVFPEQNESAFPSGNYINSPYIRHERGNGKGRRVLNVSATVAAMGEATE